MRLIDADELMHQMYRKAFIEDSNMQKWDSGCWIRYKLFERVVASVPPVVDAVVPVRCHECVHYEGNSCFVIGWYDLKPDNYCSWGHKKEEQEDA